jgi:hypothetical protein
MGARIVGCCIDQEPIVNISVSEVLEQRCSRYISHASCIVDQCAITVAGKSGCFLDSSKKDAYHTVTPVTMKAKMSQIGHFVVNF